MTSEEMAGKAQTVLGPCNADSLGITLAHEHILHDSTFLFKEPTEANEKALAYQPVTLENLNWVIYHAYNNLDNLRWDDEKKAIDELMLFKNAGGNTVVECSVRGLNANPLGLARISKATGINIIMATGYYIAMSHPPVLESMTEEEVADELVRDVTVGIGDTGVRAGLLKGACGGESFTRVEDGEQKVLRACALAQRRTGAAIGVHTPHPDLAIEVIKILGDAGADLSRTIIIHADRWGPEPLIWPELLHSGCYIEFDGIGTAERSLPVPPPGWPYRINDTQRFSLLVKLIDQGYLKQMLLSHDVWIKTRYASYGGAGYAYILLHASRLMRRIGITDEQIQTMMVENPKRILAFTPATK